MDEVRQGKDIADIYLRKREKLEKKEGKEEQARRPYFYHDINIEL